MDSESEKRMELTDVLYTASDIEARLRASYKSTRLFEFGGKRHDETR